ncbi:hypothetical protein AGMMS4952_14250 [Spirochaetia bacterium]|nr:hypothetical protein AGMMS4952_14250 [Spirochaetia bacterium]
MKNKQTMLRAVQASLLTALILAGALSLTGCINPVNDPPKTVATPTASPAAGDINPAQAISLTTDTDGAVIYYTTNGAKPSANSEAYTAPFTLTLPGRVRAIAVKAGWNNSAILSARYTAATSLPVAVTARNLNSLVTAPVKGLAPVTTAIDQTQYTGTIVWKESDETINAPAVFAGNTVYKAVVTLTAKPGFTFTDVAADSFTHNGATSVTNAVDSGTITITFPATAAEGADTIINALSLDSLVTAPVKGATPQAFTDQTQYIGTIAWTTGAGTTHSGAFAASTVYKAVVTLTAKTGFTFSGLAANSFTHNGATLVTNAVDSGTITITFPATAAESADTIINALGLDSLVTAPVTGATPQTTFAGNTQYTGTVAWTTGAGTAHSGAFAASTVYKAVVTLTAKTGFTFSGLAADSFTHDGATSVTNAVDSGTVTITFPATAAVDTIINALGLDSLVTAPVTGATPQTTFAGNTQYTGTIAWTTGAGTAHSGAFAASTVYKAVVTLTAKPGFTFTGLAANSFTHNGATLVTNAMDSGTITITFPATAAEGADTIINALGLDSLVTAPVTGATPQTTFAGNTQYTGTIAWTTGTGTAHSGAFAASTVYKAVVTLTAKTGFTFTGLAANSFTHNGATSVTNAVDSGTVTITFPATAAVDTIVNTLSLDSLVTAPVNNAAPQATFPEQTQYTGTIAWTTGAGTTHSGAFAASTVYKAVVTLTAKTGFTFTGLAADSFTHNGATSVTNAANSGTVTIAFPATGADGGGNSGGGTVVTALALDALVTAPVTGATPQAFTDQTQYIGTIAWTTGAGTAHSGAFAASTVYKAIVTLTAKTGFTFTGLAADSFTHNGATSVTNAVNSSMVTITFPATAAVDTIVNTLSLDSLVTAPVNNAAPQATFPEQTQYTGTIAWKTGADAAHTGAFARSTVYKAVVTLTAKTGFTFTGLAADSFTHNGATLVTNAVNSGTVTITFPATTREIFITAANLSQMATLIAADAVGGGGTSSTDPIPVVITIDDASLLSGTNSGGADPLHKLLAAIPAGHYVAYDLSGCTFTGIGNVNAAITDARTNEEYLASIILPNTLTSIGKAAFADCGLTSVTIPAGLTSIGDHAFYHCSGLTSVTIPASVNSIGLGAFQNCSGLTSVTIPAGLTSIGELAFAGSGLTSVTIPAGLTSIGDSAFYGCSRLTSVTIPAGLTSIGRGAFAGCGLTSVTIPAGVTSISNSAFAGSGLTSVTIPAGVKSIGNEAFAGCSGLTSVTIPAGVTSIGELAFAGSGLTSVTIPVGVTSIGDYAFQNCSGLTSVTIPVGVTSIGHYAFQNCSSLTSVTIPAGVTSIGRRAFSGCSRLTSVTIPAGLTSIVNSAFENCSGLTSVTIPASVTSIASSAFWACSGLTSVYVLRDTMPLTALGASVFADTNASLVIYVPAGVVTNYKTAAEWIAWAGKIQAGAPPGP